MHSHDISSWKHSHDFTADTSSAERRTHKVIALTILMMIVEIVAGLLLHSMALLADGWHMSTHVAAFAITALAYYFCRRHSTDQRFTFGTGKIEVLGGYTSAIILSGFALLMAVESIERLFTPVAIHFKEAIIIASVGLVANVICALILKDDPHHHHHHGHGHDHHDHDDHDHNHHHGHHDLNMRAAYLHVLADAMTSVLAILALSLGYWLGWAWLDPVMGLVGTVVIISWAFTLVRDTSSVLVDRVPADSDLPEVIRADVEGDGDSLISDLHIWQVGSGKFAAIVSVVAHQLRTPEEYRERLKRHGELVHVNVEVQVCEEHAVAT